MAISATAVWEIRSTATAANANGGFWVQNVTGTDWSQQTGAKYNLTGGTTVGISSTVVHASASSDMVGNGAHVSGTNTTSGWYEIISVVAGVSITFDRNVTTGAGAAIAMNIGGAISLGGTTANFTDANMFNSATAGNVFYIANTGSYVLGASTTITTVGTNTAPIKIIGYNTSRTDSPASANRPAFSNGAFALTMAAFWHMSYVNMSSTASTQTCQAGGDSKIFNCKFNQTSASATRFAFRANSRCVIVSNEFLSSSATDGGGIAMSAAGHAFLLGNYIHASTYGTSITGATSSTTLINNIFDSCTSKAVNMSGSTAAHLFMGNTFYGAATPAGTGIDLATGVSSLRLVNNIIWGWTTGVQHADAQANSYDDYNDYFNNTSNTSNWTVGSTSITSDPAFTNAGSGDFSVGANMKGAGFPGAFAGAGLSGTTAYVDIGAVERKEKTSTDPGVSNVKSGTNYTINDSNLTGTLAILKRNPSLDGP